jgi:uncharacterized alpha-E superfamily protein
MLAQPRSVSYTLNPLRRLLTRVNSSSQDREQRHSMNAVTGFPTKVNLIICRRLTYPVLSYLRLRE